MKRGLLVLAIGLVVLIGELYPHNANQDSRNIRRLYLEVLNTSPTPEEIDWYCIYNKDSYRAAVEYVVSFKSNRINPKFRLKNKYELYNFLLKDEFLLDSKKPNSGKTIEGIVRYASGLKDASLEECKIKLCKDSLNVSENYIDAADYIAMWLMSRTTNLEEANRLNNIVKESKAETSLKIMLKMLDVMLGFEDVLTR